MAAISQKAPSDKVLPLLARNVFAQGYDIGRPTEFLILLDRYMRQARELQALAAPNGTIRVPDCEHAGTLLLILGYRLRSGCGQKEVYLMTSDSERAFLTIDSGFPLTTLELALRKNLPFTYSFPNTRVPVLLTENDWLALGNRKGGAGFLVDVFVRNPSVARLYWAFSKMGADTQAALQRSPGLSKLLPYGGVLDFYGGQICVQSDRVLVPGGENAEAAWKDLVGANPKSYGDFVIHLVSKDNG